MPLEIRINRDELAEKKLFIATPMYGGQCAGMYAKSLADLCVLMASWGVRTQIYALFNESLITRARNYCADTFVRSDCTHMMFIDSDIGFDPRDVLAMLAMMSDDSPYDVLCGPYPKKNISWEKIKRAVDKGFADEDPRVLDRFVGDYVFNPLPGSSSIQLDAPAEVMESGTGFMMIRRSAFSLMDAAYPELSYRPDHVRSDDFDGSREIMAYFMDPIDRWSRERYYRQKLEEIAGSDDGDTREIAIEALAHDEPESKRLLSEDYFFCQSLRKAGGRIWLCPWMRLQHVGSYIFGGSLTDIAAIGSSATANPDELKPKKKK